MAGFSRAPHRVGIRIRAIAAELKGRFLGDYTRWVRDRSGPVVGSLDDFPARHLNIGTHTGVGGIPGLVVLTPCENTQRDAGEVRERVLGDVVPFTNASIA